MSRYWLQDAVDVVPHAHLGLLFDLAFVYTSAHEK
jgi:hypothetical protein